MIQARQKRHRTRVRVALSALDSVAGGLRLEDARLSTNVEDRRGEYTPVEDGLYHHASGSLIQDPTANSTGNIAGWRDDPTTGDRTWIGPDGNSTSIQHGDGSFSPPGTPVEDGLYDPSVNRTIPDPSANTDLGGYRDDPDTGNRTWIDGEGNSTGVTTADGTQLPTYTPVEDGLFDNGTHQVVDDYTANQNLGGYRDDPDTGDRTFIDGNGDTAGVQREDGSFASPHIPVEDGLYNTETGLVDNDFTANQNLGGYRDDPETGARTEIDGSGTPYSEPVDYDQGMQELSDMTQSLGGGEEAPVE